MENELLRYLERKNQHFFFARSARNILTFGKRRMQIKILAAARIIDRYEGNHGNHGRQREGKRYDPSRPKNDSERQDPGGTSLSALLARQIERLVGGEESYERSKRRALALLDKGFGLGAKIRASRDKLHER
jgi:hypothetical protein